MRRYQHCVDDLGHAIRLVDIGGGDAVETAGFVVERHVAALHLRAQRTA